MHVETRAKADTATATDAAGDLAAVAARIEAEEAAKPKEATYDIEIMWSSGHAIDFGPFDAFHVKMKWDSIVSDFNAAAAQSKKFVVITTDNILDSTLVTIEGFEYISIFTHHED